MTKAEVRAAAVSFYRDLPQSIPDWIAEYNAENTINFISTKSTVAQVEKLAEEISAYLSTKVEKELANWQKNILQPLVMTNV
ncbi:GTP-binding protein, partial [Haemophilus parainfluenzae]